MLRRKHLSRREPGNVPGWRAIADAKPEVETMASPEPADIRMRIDLALEAVAEVTARADEVLRAGDDTQAIDDFTRDVYRLFARLGQGLGEVAASLKLLERGAR